MRWPWTRGLARLVGRRRDLLDQLFGGAPCEVREDGRDTCVIAADVATLRIAYDRRDRWLASMVRFRRLPESITSDSLARFLGHGDPSPPRGPLSAAQVEAELALLARLLAPFRADPDKVGEAYRFFLRENEEYTRRGSL